MNEQRFETGKEPVVSVKCQGNLQIRGWNEPSVLIKGGDFTCHEGEKVLDIASTADLKVFVPLSTGVTITEANGDLSVKLVEGSLAIDEAKSDVSIRNVSATQVGSVMGDFSARNINGFLTVEAIMGDFVARNIEGISIGTIHGDCALRYLNGSADVKEILGDFSVRTINQDINIGACRRDVNLRNIGGLVSAEDVSGDVRLRGGLAEGKHKLNAFGDIVVRWPPNHPLILEAKANVIQNGLDLDDKVEEPGFLSGRIGDEDIFLLLEAQGRIILKDTEVPDEYLDEDMDIDFDIDLSGLGEHILSEVNNRMSEWSTKMEKNFGPAFAARIEKTAQEAAEKAEKAAEKAVRKAEKAAKKARYQADRSSWSAPKPASQPQPTKAEKATEEEQIKILRMVEKGVISPDEASTLLEAIGS